MSADLLISAMVMVILIVAAAIIAWQVFPEDEHDEQL